MRTLGLFIQKGSFRYAVLEGTRADPILVAKDRLITPDPDEVPHLMDWYDSQFRQLISAHKPERIAYRLILDPNKEQLLHSEFPLGILNLIAYQRNLPITPYVAQSYTPSRLGLQKGTDLYALCDEVFGQHPPYWDKNQKHAILCAWFKL